MVETLTQSPNSIFSAYAFMRVKYPFLSESQAQVLAAFASPLNPESTIAETMRITGMSRPSVKRHRRAVAKKFN